MNKSFRMFSAGLVAIGLLSACLPAEAASKTFSARVSCTIAPTLGVSMVRSLSAPAAGMTSTTRTTLGLSGQDSGVAVDSNLGKNIQFYETSVNRAGAITKLFSVTAL